ncbi:MAG: PEP-CTERM sorting domain-containing protein, partial [Planctomycetota bacterium]
KIQGLMAALVCCGLTPAYAALVTTHVDDNADGATVDGTLAADEYNLGNSYAYGGGGTGFGGTLGNGTLYMESDGTDLYVGLNITGDLGGDAVTVFLDTKSGGFSDDSLLTDTADAGRAMTSDLTRDVADRFPVEADYALQFGNGYSVLFELVNSGSHGVVTANYAGTGGSGSAGFREASVSLADLGSGPNEFVDFFAVLISGSNFASNEAIPDPGIANNPGFDNAANGGGPVTWPDFHRFTTIPEPATISLLGVGALAMILRRKQA